ncbi:SpoIID/LytB domain-containing protein [bacterium]|nr:SpoIID/LytB domain-containing protein [bacterium]
MKLLIGALILFTQFAQAKSVRVKMGDFKSQVNIIAKNLRVKNIFNVEDEFFKTNKFKISLQQDNDKWLWSIETQSKSKIIELPFVKIAADKLRINNKNYPGSVIMYPLKNNTIELIAYVDLESYLMGVLPSEMPASWPQEALKAQAIASRSYTLALLRARKDKHYDLKSTVLDQVFSDFSNLDLNSYYEKKINQVISATRGEFMMRANYLPEKTYYHADCGGTTEEAKYVWGGKKPSVTVIDAFCPLSPFAKWSYDLGPGKLAQFSKLKDLKILSKTPSGRVNQIQLTFENQKPKLMSSQKFRELVGFSKIKSTFFRIQKFKNLWHVWGKGHGHGVGMCQWGAKILARKGLKYQEILKHYYPLSTLSSDRMYSNLQPLEANRYSN